MLAAEVTRLVHGAEALARAERLTAVLFAGDDLGDLTDRELAEAFAHSPSTDLPRAALGTPEAALTTVLAATALAASRGQARKDIASGGVYVTTARVADPTYVLSDATSWAAASSSCAGQEVLPPGAADLKTPVP